MIKKTNFNPEPLIEHMKSVPYELVHTALYDGPHAARPCHETSVGHFCESTQLPEK